ncbi:MAG TPA: EAL domain-containing protein [Thermoleophilaceae bacterium]
MTTTVLIADDEQEFRSALAEVVRRADGLTLVGEATDATDAIELGSRLRPAVAIVDVRMDGGGGARVAKQLANIAPEVRILALSAYDDHATIMHMLKAGASGYLLKGTSARELVEAIERTAAGTQVLSPEIPAELAPRTPAERVKPVRVIVADDNPEFLEAVGMLVQRDPDFALVGKARDTRGAIRLATMYEPDIALIDWRMPGGGGATAATEIIRSSSKTRVIALSSSRQRDAVLEMLRAGASSYVVKSVAGNDLMNTLRATAAGHSTLSSEVASPMIEELVVSLGRPDHSSIRAEEVARIRSVIDEAALRMEFQPIVDMAHGRTIGVEALARFDVEPRRSPDVWFGDAAAAGLGADLDMAAAQQALAILPELPPGVDLFVNVRPESIFSTLFGGVMAEAPGERVVLELTEHSPVHDYDRVKQTVAELRAAGFRIAVDDVGAGYASLRHLINLRPDVLKIDISLCRSIEHDRALQVCAGALISLGRELGAQVVAEGIETGAEHAAVRELGVDSAQGYFLGRPASPPLAEMLSGPGVNGGPH